MDRGGGGRWRGLPGGGGGNERHAPDSALHCEQASGSPQSAHVGSERQREGLHRRSRLQAGSVSVRLLALDTTGEYGSIALVDERGIAEEVALYSPEGFAHILFGQIGSLLARNGLSLDNIDARSEE